MSYLSQFYRPVKEIKLIHFMSSHSKPIPAQRFEVTLECGHIIRLAKRASKDIATRKHAHCDYCMGGEPPHVAIGENN
jgi:hypothetical protein